MGDEKYQQENKDVTTGPIQITDVQEESTKVTTHIHVYKLVF